MGHSSALFPVVRVHPIGLRDVWGGYIDRTWRTRRSAAKHLARLTGASPRTAENWLARHQMPQAEHLIALMRACPQLRAEIISICTE